MCIRDRYWGGKLACRDLRSHTDVYKRQYKDCFKMKSKNLYKHDLSVCLLQDSYFINLLIKAIFFFALAKYSLQTLVMYCK